MDILKLINKAVSAANPKEYRQYIGASSIGKPCKRAIWYGYHGAEQKDVSSALQITFDIGKTLEKLLLEYIGLTDLKLEIPLEENKWLFCQDSELKEFQGHMDGLLYLDELSPTVLEIKTAKSSSFQKFVKDGLLKWNYIYYAQLQAYMGMANLNKINWKEISVIALLKLMVLPLITLIVLVLLKLNPLISFVAMLNACMPCSITLSIIGRNYETKDQSFINQAIFVTHLLSMITIPIFLGLYGKLFN